MNKLKIIIIINILFQTTLISQNINDDLLFPENNIKLKEGIYINFDSFKKNKPINKNFIVTNIPLNALDFYKKLSQTQTIFFFDTSGIKKQIDTKNIWGYSENNHVYINYNAHFYKIPALGRISQFIAKIKVMRTETDPLYSGYYNMATRTYEYEETHHFLLSLDNGQIYEYNYKNVEKLISPDKELFNEYIKLKKRQRKKLAYKYISLYNKRNPIKF